MQDKRFLKVKKASEERLFRDRWELIKFIEKQSGNSWDCMWDTYSNVLSYNKRAAERYRRTKLNLDGQMLIIGNFLFTIFRGYYERTSGDYTINMTNDETAAIVTNNDNNILIITNNG